MMSGMDDVTRILQAIDRGEPQRSGELLPLVYQELRRMAAAKMTHERPEQTLSPTALVHEAYLRLVGPADSFRWQSRAHFFAAAAEAMRRILVENARKRARIKHGGAFSRCEINESALAISAGSPELIALDEALTKLSEHDPEAAEVVKLRFFAGRTVPQTAEILNLSPRKVDMVWAFARAWLRREMESGDGP
jgi:RNA polymerase sigma factor (TIGR02999 family)